MRQIATGAEGTGYEIVFARRNPDEVPEGIAELRKAIDDAKEPEERQRRVEAFGKVHAEWQAEWEKNPKSYVAHLVVDGRVHSESDTGEAARAIAQKLEPAIDNRVGAAPLRWRTE